MSTCRFPSVRRNSTDGRPYPCSCRQCFGCRMRAREDLVRRMNMEVLSCYSQGFSPSFVTFTYDDKHIPRDGSLHMSEIQGLRKRMYQNLKDRHIPQPRQGFKYLLVGEYGDQFGRCHLHGVFPSIGSACSDFFSDAWQDRGQVRVLPLLRGGIRYCLKYMDKHQKEYDDLYVKAGMEPPMRAHSTRIGLDYLRDNERELRERNGIMWNGRVHYMDYYNRKQYGLDSSPVDYSLLRSKAHESGQSLGTYMARQNWLAEYSAINKARESSESVDASHLWANKDKVGDWYRYLDTVYDPDFKPVSKGRSYELAKYIFETEDTL